jgi:hypothetical protein
MVAEKFAQPIAPAGSTWFTDPNGVSVTAPGNLWAWPANFHVDVPSPAYTVAVPDFAAMFAYDASGKSTPAPAPYLDANYTNMAIPVATVFNAPQIRVNQFQADYRLPQTGHNVEQVALADGSVRGVSVGVQQQTWYSAVVPSDGAILGPDWNE